MESMKEVIKDLIDHNIKLLKVSGRTRVCIKQHKHYITRRIRTQIIIEVNHHDGMVAIMHEIGHVKHKLGLLPNNDPYCLTSELAANSWVLANLHLIPYPKEVAIMLMRQWILTYLVNGHITAMYTPELKQTAIELGIYHMIIWDTTRSISQMIKYSASVFHNVQ